MPHGTGIRYKEARRRSCLGLKDELSTSHLRVVRVLLWYCCRLLRTASSRSRSDRGRLGGATPVRHARCARALRVRGRRSRLRRKGSKSKKRHETTKSGTPNSHRATTTRSCRSASGATASPGSFAIVPTQLVRDHTSVPTRSDGYSSASGMIQGVEGRPQSH